MFAKYDIANNFSNESRSKTMNEVQLQGVRFRPRQAHFEVDAGDNTHSTNQEKIDDVLHLFETTYYFEDANEAIEMSPGLQYDEDRIQA